jgi:hypothetical protein
MVEFNIRFDRPGMRVEDILNGTITSPCHRHDRPECLLFDAFSVELHVTSQVDQIGVIIPECAILSVGLIGKVLAPQM